MKLSKKGQVFQQLGALGVAVATLSIILVVTFLIISQGRTVASNQEGIVYNATDCTTSSTCNATSTLMSAVDDIPTWMPIVIITAIGSILLGLVQLFRVRGRY